jgi:hypothetical protein
MTGIELITQERKEQIEVHGKTPEYDHKHNLHRQLPYAVAILTNTFLLVGLHYIPINWDETAWRKIHDKSYIERLTIAGAFCAAEIDRVQLENEKHPITITTEE